MCAFGLIVTGVTLPGDAAVLEPKFASVVEAERYPSARAPETVPVFKWKFSEKRDYRYRYEQTSTGRMHGSGAESETSTKTSAAGDLVVRSNGDGTARLVLENVKAKSSLDGGESGHEFSQDLPTAVLAGLRDDGTVESAASSQQALVRLLFPLPAKPLKVGESADLPIEIPFSAMGSSFPAKGALHLTNVGWVMLGKRLCVELRGETTFQDLRLPEEIAGKYQFGMRAVSVFFFDPAEQRFIRGVIATSSMTSADVPTPDGGRAEMPKGQVAPERFKMSGASDDLITLSAE